MIHPLYEALTGLAEIDEPKNARRGHIGQTARERCRRMTNTQ